jgi:pilus assembly protein Flp/PilA
MSMTYRDKTNAAGAHCLLHHTPSAVRRKEVTSLTIRSTFNRLTSFIRRDERGQGLAEYALILALIAIIAIIALIFMGSQVSDKLSIIGSTLQSVAP